MYSTLCIQMILIIKEDIQLLECSIIANCKIMNPEEWQHKVPWVCVKALVSQLSSITLLLLWRTRRSSASSTFLLILLLSATPRRGWGFTLPWCAELMEMLEKHSGLSCPQNTNVSFLTHFLPAFPSAPWWLISCFRPSGPARTISGLAERE